MASKDGKGRTLWDILTGQNKKDMTPLELQYHNPLKAKVGCTVSIEDEDNYSGINFVIEKVSVYETRFGNQKFYHTDYYLKGMTLDLDTPIRLRLRLIPDVNKTNKLGHKILLLSLYDEMEWDENFHNGVLCNEQGIFDVNYDDAGKELAEPSRYWRIDDVKIPYNCRMTTLVDKDGNGKVDDDELIHEDIQYWDYHRQTQDDSGSFIEYLFVEMNKKFFTFFRGTEVEAFQITVI